MNSVILDVMQQYLWPLEVDNINYEVSVSKSVYTVLTFSNKVIKKMQAAH